MMIIVNPVDTPRLRGEGEESPAVAVATPHVKISLRGVLREDGTGSEAARTVRVAQRNHGTAFSSRARGAD